MMEGTNAKCKGLGLIYAAGGVTSGETTMFDYMSHIIGICVSCQVSHAVCVSRNLGNSTPFYYPIIPVLEGPPYGAMGLGCRIPSIFQAPLGLKPDSRPDCYAPPIN